MRLDDRPADGEPHADAVILRREERAEDLVRLLRRQSHAGVADRDQQVTVVGFRRDGELISAARSMVRGVRVAGMFIGHGNILNLSCLRLALAGPCER